MTKGDTKWENPPGLRGSTWDWEAIAERAKSRPGQWLKVEGPVATGSAFHIRHGCPVPFSPAGSFNAVIRNSSTAAGYTGDLYIRYIGE